METVSTGKAGEQFDPAVPFPDVRERMVVESDREAPESRDPENRRGVQGAPAGVDGGVDERALVRRRRGDGAQRLRDARDPCQVVAKSALEARRRRGDPGDVRDRRQAGGDGIGNQRISVDRGRERSDDQDVQCAPFAERTAGTVRARMIRSIFRDQLSM